MPKSHWKWFNYGQILQKVFLWKNMYILTWLMYLWMWLHILIIKNVILVSNPTPNPEEDGPLKKFIWESYVQMKNGPILSISNSYQDMKLKAIDEDLLKKIEFWTNLLDSFPISTMNSPTINSKMFTKRFNL